MDKEQCEKFKYMDLLIKTENESSRKLQMCCVSSFLTGETFLNPGRNLKIFNPIIGETYEYLIMKKN